MEIVHMIYRVFQKECANISPCDKNVNSELECGPLCSLEWFVN